MKFKGVATFSAVSLALALVALPATAKDSSKATPPAKSNSNSNSNSSSNSNSNTNSSSSSNSNSNSSSKSDKPSTTSSAAQTNNSGQGNSGQSAQSSTNGSANTATTESRGDRTGAPAVASTNKRLNPGLVPAERANGRAEKAPRVETRASEDCRTTTAKGKAKVESDPCSDFIVVFQPGFARSNSTELLKNSSAQIKRQFNSIFNGALVNGPLSKMQALANNPNVLVVEDDLEVTAFAIQSSAPWGLDRIDQITLPLSASFDDGDLAGANTYAYVVDTGIDATNTDFEGRVTPGFTAVLDGQGSKDCNGHGTHVAGTIAGARFGVAKKTTLIPVRVLDCSGSGSYSSVITGLDWIAANHKPGEAAVVNMSLGGPASSTLDGAIKNLISKGVNVVVAAGNSSADACNYSPARVPDALTVGATTDSDQRATYSNFGSCLDIFAPGSSITSTWLGSNATNTISGTSMASPHVAGVVARFIANNSGLTPQQVANSLKKSGTSSVLSDVGSSSPNSLLFLNVTPDTTAAPVDSSPTFQKTNPRGKIIGKR